MDKKNNALPYNLIGGIVFVILALTQLFSGSALWGIVWFAGEVLVAVALFRKRLDVLPIVGFAFLAAASLIHLILGFFTNAYTTIHLRTSVDAITVVNLFCILPNIWELAAFTAMLMLAVSIYNGKNSIREIPLHKCFYIPALGIAASLFSRWVIFGVIRIFGDAWTQAAFGVYSLVWHVLAAAGLLFSALWIISAEAPAPISKKHDENDGYIDMAQHVLLLIFTFGVWNLIWIYKTTRYCNRVEGAAPRDPTNKLLLCIFVPFYTIYWVYQSAQRIDKLAAEAGESSSLTTPCLVLAFFISILPPILMQDKINALSRHSVRVTSATPSQGGIKLGVAGELKTYKELLDSGVITQEEFDAKKAELLSL